MSKIKETVMLILGAISAFFYILLQMRNRKIRQQQEEIKQHKNKNQELAFINQQENTAKHEKNTINTSSEPDVDRLLEQNKAYRD